MNERVVDVVAPDAHVPVRAFALDRVVPAVRDDVAVNVGIAVRAALETVVAAAPDSVVEAVIVGGADGVIADDVAAAAIDEGDALRAGGVAGLPIVGAAARVLDQVALNNQVSCAGLGKNRTV